MTPPEAQLAHLMRCLERENALFLAMMARGYTLEEAEEALHLCEMWVLWGLRPPQAALEDIWRGVALRYNPPQSAPAGHP